MAADPKFDEQELIDGIRVGRAAEELLSEPIIERAFADIEAAIVSLMTNAATDNVERIMHFRRMLEAHRKYRGVLEAYVKKGEIDYRRLEQERTRLQKLGDTFAGIRR